MFIKSIAIVLTIVAIPGTARAQERWFKVDNQGDNRTVLGYAIAGNDRLAGWKLSDKRTNGGYKVFRNKDLVGGGIVKIYGGKSIWGINDKRRIFRYDPKKRRWNTYPGRADDLGVNRSDKLWRLKTDPERALCLVRFKNGNKFGSGQLTNQQKCPPPNNTHLISEPYVTKAILAEWNGKDWAVKFTQYFLKKDDPWQQVYVDTAGAPWLITKSGKVFPPKSFKRSIGKTKALAFVLGDIWKLGPARKGNGASNIYVLRHGQKNWEKTPNMVATQIAVVPADNGRKYSVFAVNGRKIYELPTTRRR